MLSLVRSSERGGKDGIGFLRDERRLNVAVTRAKRHCALICDSDTVSQNTFIKGLIDWMEEKGDYHSGAEFLQDRDVTSCKVEGGGFSPIDDKITTKKRIKHSDEKQTKNQEIQQNSETSKSEKDINNSLLTAAINSNEEVSTSEANSKRMALMEKIKKFSALGKKGDELILDPGLSRSDFVIVRKLADHLGLGHHIGNGHSLILYVGKEPLNRFHNRPIGIIHDIDTTKFGELDVGDDSSKITHNVDNTNARAPTCTNDFLQDLALEREARQSKQKAMQLSKAPPSTSSKKVKGGKKEGARHLAGQKLLKLMMILMILMT